MYSFYYSFNNNYKKLIEIENHTSGSINSSGIRNRPQNEIDNSSNSTSLNVRVYHRAHDYIIEANNS